MVGQPVECVYCSAANPTTLDHIPPKGIFPPPRSANLITVPCCKECNASFGRDDEYFRAVLASRDDVGSNAAALALMDTIYRGLSRPQSAGFKTSFLAATYPVELLTSSGIYVGQSMGINVEYPRLERVTARIIRGMYFRETGIKLPLDCEINTYLDKGFSESIQGGDTTVINLVDKLSSRPANVIEPDVFGYWHQIVDSDRHLSAWLLLFYKRIWFLGITDDGSVKEAVIQRKQM